MGGRGGTVAVPRGVGSADAARRPARGAAAPALVGPADPHPAGCPPGRGRTFPWREHAGAALEVSSGGAALAKFGRRVGALRAGRGQRPATPRGDVFPPPDGALRRRGGGLNLGVQAGAKGVGAEGAQRPKGRRIGLRDEPAPRARLSLKPIKPIYTYWVPFSVLAKSRFRYWRMEKLGRAKTLFGLGPKLGLVPIPGHAVDNF
ncbi:hypothetical protein FBY20_1394 [Achromobacter sp. SLBN-14]|nr:hypothetical protein FBY20_1394 [Achromobacter sp. SLBN-14]